MKKIILPIFLTTLIGIHAQNKTEVFKEGKRYGLKSASGEVIVEPIYKLMKDLDYGFFSYGDYFDQGLMDKNGNIICELIHGTLKPFNANGIAPVRLALPNEEDKNIYVVKYAYAAIDTTGKILFTPTFEEIEAYNNHNAAPFKQEEKYGLVDASGNVLAEAKYDKISSESASNDIYLIESSGKIGLIDSDGNIVVEPVYQEIKEFNEFNIAIFKQNEKYGLLNKEGQEVIGAEYDQIQKSYSDKTNFLVKKDEKSGRISFSGEIILPTIYEEIGKFSCSCPGQDGKYARYSRDGKFGYLDTNFTEILIPTYDEAHIFMHGLAGVKKDGKWGYINQDFDVVIPFEYDKVFGFYDDTLAVVIKDGKYSYINKDGSTHLEVDYDSAEEFNEGLAVVGKDGKYGYINRSGELIIPMIYTEANDFYKGKAIVYIKKKRFRIDPKGNKID